MSQLQLDISIPQEVLQAAVDTIVARMCAVPRYTGDKPGLVYEEIAATVKTYVATLFTDGTIDRLIKSASNVARMRQITEKIVDNELNRVIRQRAKHLSKTGQLFSEAGEVSDAKADD